MAAANCEDIFRTLHPDARGYTRCQDAHTRIDYFYGNNNLQDVLNTQFEVGNRLVTLLRRGDLFANLYQVTSDSTLTPFIERFSNVLAGYELVVSIEMKNDISIC